MGIRVQKQEERRSGNSGRQAGRQVDCTVSSVGGSKVTALRPTVLPGSNWVELQGCVPVLRDPLPLKQRVVRRRSEEDKGPREDPTAIFKEQGPYQRRHDNKSWDTDPHL